jgi:hypothetical protein
MFIKKNNPNNMGMVVQAAQNQNQPLFKLTDVLGNILATFGALGNLILPAPNGGSNPLNIGITISPATTITPGDIFIDATGGFNWVGLNGTITTIQQGNPDTDTGGGGGTQGASGSGTATTTPTELFSFPANSNGYTGRITFINNSGSTELQVHTTATSMFNGPYAGTINVPAGNSSVIDLNVADLAPLDGMTPPYTALTIGVSSVSGTVPYKYAYSIVS